jgi:hypothetical protein
MNKKIKLVVILLVFISFLINNIYAQYERKKVYGVHDTLLHRDYKFADPLKAMQFKELLEQRNKRLREEQQGKKQELQVIVQGISDGIRNSKQYDRDEAIIDAKLKSIEQAGVDIQSVTTVENYQLKKDWIESRAQAYILPGFEIVDVGYGEDGLYHVVLVGKVLATTPVR